MKLILHVIFGIFYLLLTFFGIGPILLADGTAGERFITICIVVLLYILLTVLLRWLMKWMNKKG